MSNRQLDKQDITTHFYKEYKKLEISVVANFIKPSEMALKQVRTPIKNQKYTNIGD